MKEFEAAFGIWQSVREWVDRFNQDKSRVFDQILLSLREFSSGEDGFQSWASLLVGARLQVSRVGALERVRHSSAI